MEAFDLQRGREFATLRHSFQVQQKGAFVMAEESNVHHLAWFLAGLGVGAMVGILYAPKSGRETREDLANGAREGTEYLRHRTRQAAEEVSALVDKSKEQVGEYVERGREAVDRGRAQWEEFVERGKNIVAEQATKVSAAVEAGREAYKTTTTDDEPAKS
jgi:gas vesicle protein